MAGTALLAACSHDSGGSATSADQNGYQNVVRDALPSVVFITTGSGVGSGVVYDGKGDIVTNAHVVGDATRVEVTFSTGGAPRAASLVGRYPADDLAVVRVEGSLPVRAATFAGPDSVAVGQKVLAIGSPLGLTSTVTDGIVSAVGRTVSDPGTANSPPTNIPDMVQTSAAINPGNSGGALVDLHGHVVGIPTLGVVDPNLGNPAAGIGFAISSRTATHIADQLIKDGHVTSTGRASLGVTVGPAHDAQGRATGADVVTVDTGGPAAGAGIRPGDIITAIGRSAVTGPGSLPDALGADRPGDRVDVSLTRGGERRTVTVTLGEL
jgi:S1-C subfamily serine protease